jgi:hypothetical protein
MEIELWIWWFLHDWQGEGFAEYFRSMGFLTSDGKEKASWSTWKEIHAQPKAK